jgi:trans-feruloyl-CoA hydratase/vanillin synthase
MAASTADAYETIRIEKEDGITWAILNRPEKRNAMNPKLHFEMEAALSDLATDPETKVLILTGAGEAFSAGQDLKLYFREAKDPKQQRKARRAANNWRWQILSTFPKPTIAMVNGYCFGGAFTQVCACDFAIAAADAVFGLSEINWGMVPGGIVSWNITQVMSFRDAMYYAVTGETFTGQEAAQMRFINRAVPKADLRAETLKLAKMLMAKNPVAVKYTKEAIRAVRNMNVNDAFDYLDAKIDALKFNDKTGGTDEALKQFIDDKSYRPGFGSYHRPKQ